MLRPYSLPFVVPLTLVVVLLAACTNGADDGSDSTPSSTNPTTSAPITTTTVTVPNAFSWSHVPDDEAVFGGASNQSMWDVTAGGPGLVAVGMDESNDDGDAAVWTSVDGNNWVRVPHDETVFGGRGLSADRRRSRWGTRSGGRRTG